MKVDLNTIQPNQININRLKQKKREKIGTNFSNSIAGREFYDAGISSLYKLNFSGNSYKNNKPINFCAVNISPRYKKDDNKGLDLVHESLKKLKKSDTEEKFQKNSDRYDSLTLSKYKDASGGSWYDNMQTIREEAGQKKILVQEQVRYAQELKENAVYNAMVIRDLERQLEAKEKAQDARLNKIASYQNSSYLDNKGFNRIVGYDKEKDILYRYFITQIQNEKNGKTAKIPNAILFFGPKGNGKTTFATAFAQEIGCDKPIIVLATGNDTNSIYSKLYNNLLKAANRAEEIYQKTGTRQVIFMDEFVNASDDESTILPELEDFIVNCSNNYHCILFAATNYPLDIALPIDTNENIFPYIVSLEPPNLADKAKILQYYLKDKLSEPTAQKDFIELAKMLEEKENNKTGAYSIAEIKKIVTKKGGMLSMTLEEIKKKIEASYPNISIENLEDFYDAKEKLIQNEVE